MSSVFRISQLVCLPLLKAVITPFNLKHFPSGIFSKLPMLSPETTLNEFILHLPTYCDSSDWENWASAFYTSPLRAIAIVDRNEKPKGIIYYHSLLDLWAKEPCEEENNFYNSRESFFKTAIVPLVSVSSQTKVTDFFKRFSSSNQRQKDYFIVNDRGNLLGILDTVKLLDNLWSNHKLKFRASFFSSISSAELTSSREKANPDNNNVLQAKAKTAVGKTYTKNQSKILEKIELSEINSTLYKFVNELSFPLAIENVYGEICYQNSYWQKEIRAQQQFIDLVNIESCSDRFGENSNLDSVWGASIIGKSSNTYYCKTENNLGITSGSINNLQRQTYRLESNLAELTPQYSKSGQTARDRLNEEQNSSWYYYRLPLIIKPDRVNITDTPNYWLKFATKISLLQNFTNNVEQQRQQDLQYLQQLQNKFIHGIIHDIKSPLTAIIGLSSLLKEEKLGTLNFNQARYTKMIYQSGKMLIDSIDDFVNIANLTSKKLELNLESVDIENTCKKIYLQVVKKLKAVAAIKNYAAFFPELQLDIDSQANYAIADKTYFCQIITCFLENALQLVNTDELLGITAEPWSNWLAITVWNEGGGFSDVRQTFSEFEEYSNIPTSKAKNQILGLILARKLAQAHGGDISYISEANYGSEFTLLLPARPRSFQVENSAVESHDNHARRRNQNSLVLLIANESRLIIDLNEKLKALGYYCAVARSAAEALDKTRCLKPYKILLSSSFGDLSERGHIITTLKADTIAYRTPLLVADLGFAQNHSFYNLADEILSFPLSKAKLAKYFTPIQSRRAALAQNLTVLRLSLTDENTPLLENFTLDYVFENPSFNLSHHIIEADNIEQADLLATIWDIDAVIWDGATLKSPQIHLESFAKSIVLSSIPVITLDARTTAIANKIASLAVFPCLLPAKQRSIEQLTQVIQIAAGLK